MTISEWANLPAIESLRAAAYLYQDLEHVIAFGIDEEGSVGTLFTPDSSPMELLWMLKGLELSTVMEFDDPMPLLTDDYLKFKDDISAETMHPILLAASEQMEGVAHTIAVGMLPDRQITIASSEEVDFMHINFCADWCRHQILAQLIDYEDAEPIYEDA